MLRHLWIFGHWEVADGGFFLVALTQSCSLIMRENLLHEDLLHYVWRFDRFDRQALTTTQGEPVQILELGHYNRYSGPDFLNARIRIGDTLWVGNVEMHLYASEWEAHRHTADPAYQNVILHVVLDEDVPVISRLGERIPCVELRKRIPAGLSSMYQRLLHSAHWVPCQHQLHTVPGITRSLWLDRLMIERLEKRTLRWAERLEANAGDWEETFYQALAQGLGGHVNAQPFELLARSLPLGLLLRYRHSRFQMEALLFGQAGLLSEHFEDEYPSRLLKEYRFLRQKHELTPLPEGMWKFMRMRPANFPTIRVAQLAALLHQSGALFGKALVAANLTEVEHMFEVKLSNYWQDHYTFGKVADHKPKALGRSAIHLLVINTLAPMLFLYGKRQGDERHQSRALALLEETPAEHNAIIQEWNRLGLSAASAYHSQALLELKNNYCDQKRCLHCAIGSAIVGQAGASAEEPATATSPA